jgi:acyl dehydratase
MTQEPKADYYKIALGYEFPPRTYTLDSQTVSTYLEAVKESHDLYTVEKLVPPLAITAYAMTALAEGSTFPAGTVHVTQELDFVETVRVGETITCRSKISRRLDRGGMRIMTTDIAVYNEEQRKVLGGKVGFVLPSPEVRS